MFASAQTFSRNLAGAAGTLFFAGLCIAGATAPAKAQIAYSVNESGRQMAYVSYADLDLATAAGRNRLESRVRSAAKRVCHSNVNDPWSVAEEHKCFHETLKTTRNATMAAIAADKAVG